MFIHCACVLFLYRSIVSAFTCSCFLSASSPKLIIRAIQKIRVIRDSGIVFDANPCSTSPWLTFFVAANPPPFPFSSDCFKIYFMIYLYVLCVRVVRVLAILLLCMPAAFTQPTIEFNPIATGLPGAVDVVNAGDGSDRLFIVQRTGEIRIFSGGMLVDDEFLDLGTVVENGNSEQGLLSLAFHPDYENNGVFFVYYTRDGDGAVELARYTVSADANVANPTGQVLLTIPKPSGRDNHNGGKLIFGTDGYLYVGVGDGGGTGDPDNLAQNGNALQGKMLRLDVNDFNSTTYAIPAGNPYIGNAAVLDEIWAIGLRNPWRWSFDRLNGDMWIADVGQGTTEELNFRAAGTTGGINYGWRCYEGTNDYDIAGCLPPVNYISPVFQYPHNGTTGGFSVTGGYVYRGTDTRLYGYYIMADYVSGNVWKIIPTGPNTWDVSMQDDLPGNISGFGEDEDGELYSVSLTGTLYRVLVSGPALPVTLTDFTAVPGNGSVALSWKTEYESNSKHFEVEYSNDGVSFQQAGIVASGNYTNGHAYHFNHVAVNTGKLYYRLKMVDVDGQFDYSNIISAVITGIAKNYIYPTIITTGTVSLYLSESFRSVEIHTMDGKLLRKENINGKTGRVDVPLPAFASGLCVVKLAGSDPQKNIAWKIIIR